MGQQKHYQLSIENRNLVVAVKINDVLVHSDRDNRVPHYEMSINQWLFNDENTIAVNLSVAPNMEELSETVECSIAVEEIVVQGDSQKKTTLTTLAYNHANEDMQFPILLNNTFTIDTSFPVWKWRSGLEFDADNLPYDMIIAFTEKIVHALKAKDGTAVAELLRTKNEELANAYYIPINERLHDSTAFFEKLFAMDGWDIIPPDYGSMVMQLQAENKLLLVANSRGKPLIQTPVLDDDFRFGIPLYLANVNDTFVLCR